MKLLILLFSCCLVAVQSSPAKKMTDREHAGFIGPVKSVYLEYEMPERNYGDRLQGKHCRGLTDVYNAAGQLIQHSVYPGSCGEDEIRESYAYASDGSRTTKKADARDKNSPSPSGGFSTGPSGDTGPVRETYRHDASGRLVESSLVRQNGKLIAKYVYVYDSMGRLIETRSVEANGAISDRRVNGYEGSNKAPSTFSYIDGRGKAIERSTYSDYEFNAQGDWIKRKMETEETLSPKQTLIETRKIEYYGARN